MTGKCGCAYWINASTYLRMSAVLGRVGACVLLRPAPGDSGELTLGCENFRWVWPPKHEGCDRLMSKACLVASVIESVDTEVTELWRALPVIDEDATLGLSELKLESDDASCICDWLANKSCISCGT